MSVCPVPRMSVGPVIPKGITGEGLQSPMNS